jgi:hypothetical protein
MVFSSTLHCLLPGRGSLLGIGYERCLPTTTIKVIVADDVMASLHFVAVPIKMNSVHFPLLILMIFREVSIVCVMLSYVPRAITKPSLIICQINPLDFLLINESVIYRIEIRTWAMPGHWWLLGLLAVHHFLCVNDFHMLHPLLFLMVPIGLSHRIETVSRLIFDCELQLLELLVSHMLIIMVF